MVDTEHNSIRGGKDMTMTRTLEVDRDSEESDPLTHFGWHFGDHGDCWQESWEHCQSNTTREYITRIFEVMKSTETAWRGFIVQLAYWFIGSTINAMIL